MSRSPIELLGAILDEVEGLRRTDAASHLPAAMLLELREAVNGSAFCTEAEAAGPSDVTSLVGRTVAHVFEDDLKRGDLLILCTDGTFVALESLGEDAGITEMMQRGPIADYIAGRGLFRAGLINAEQRDHIENAEKRKKLEAMAARARQQLAAAEKLLAETEGPKP